MPEVIIRSDELNRFAKAARTFDKSVLTRLRKNIRGVGMEAVEKVQSTVRQPAPTGGSSGKGSRSQIAARTKLSISFAERAGGIKIRTTPGGLGNFAAGYNKAKPFRHRVFGQDVWVTQQGRPYFGVAILQVWDKSMEQAMTDALMGAVDELERATR